MTLVTTPTGLRYLTVLSIALTCCAHVVDVAAQQRIPALERDLDAENDSRRGTGASSREWVFTDLLTAGAPLKAVHFIELREAVNAVRVPCRLPPVSWTDPVIIPHVTPVKALHLTELRAALMEAYTACGPTPVPTYTDVVRAGTPVRAVHVTELRDAVNVALATRAELVVESPRVIGAAPMPGDTFTFSVTVRNIGTGPSEEVPLLYYMEWSGSTIRSPRGSDVVPILRPSGSSTHSIMLTVPSFENPRFYACVEYNPPGPFTALVETCSDAVEITVVQPGTECVTDLGVVMIGTVVREGEWTERCESANREGRYVRYYNFTLSQQATVTIDLTSSVDTYLYLLQGSGTGGAVLSQNDDVDSGTNSRIVNPGLSPGTYTIEATTYRSGSTGHFRLELKVSSDGAGLGLVLESLPVNDRLMPGDTFTFSVTVRNIGTGPSEEVPLLYYMEWSGSTIRSLRGSDVVPILRPSRSSTHSIMLTVPSFENPRFYACVEYNLPGPFTALVETCSDAVEITVVQPGTECVTDLGVVMIGTVVREGEWTGRCESANREGRYVRYYNFTLSQQATVTIDLTSSVDTYLYLLQGSGTGGAVLSQNDDVDSGTNSRIVNPGLSPGTYTIEATTYRSGSRGDFRLELEVSGGANQAVVGALAIGYDPSGGVVAGWSRNQESADSARRGAINDCRSFYPGRPIQSECSVVTVFEHCAAAAIDFALIAGTSAYSPIYGWATGIHEGTVRQEALADCNSKGGTRCQMASAGVWCNDSE